MVEGLEPGVDAPWYARFAWVNLFPAAPENPPGNPAGALKEAQEPDVGRLLRATTDMLEATRVILIVEPFWWPAAGPAGLADLPERPRPLYRGGRIKRSDLGRGLAPEWSPLSRLSGGVVREQRDRGRRGDRERLADAMSHVSWAPSFGPSRTTRPA